MAYDEALAERLRDRLADQPGVTERRMFGGLAVLTFDAMTVGVFGDDLIVRVGPDAARTALGRPGVRRFDITGRPMKGWVLVAGDVLDDPELDAWIAQARAYVATLPPRRPR
jgi:TfoX/Sxy family transcriptional regulator of competence genes